MILRMIICIITHRCHHLSFDWLQAYGYFRSVISADNVSSASKNDIFLQTNVLTLDNNFLAELRLN